MERTTKWMLRIAIVILVVLGTIAAIQWYTGLSPAEVLYVSIMFWLWVRFAVITLAVFYVAFLAVSFVFTLINQFRGRR